MNYNNLYMTNEAKQTIQIFRTGFFFIYYSHSVINNDCDWSRLTSALKSNRNHVITPLTWRISGEFWLIIYT